MVTRDEYLNLKRETDALLEAAADADFQAEQEERQARDRAERNRLERIAAAAERTAAHTAPKMARSSMSVQEKTAFIGRHGRDKYLALPWSRE